MPRLPPEVALQVSLKSARPDPRASASIPKDVAASLKGQKRTVKLLIRITLTYINK